MLRCRRDWTGISLTELQCRKEINMKGGFINELPYERLVRKICGSQWRELSKPEIDAAWGVAIVKSILEGVRPEIGEVARHLGVSGDDLIDAYRRLNLNGLFKNAYLERDRSDLQSGDELAWCYYGGYASGAIGIGS